MSKELKKSIRISDPIFKQGNTKISVYQDGKRKYAIWYSTNDYIDGYYDNFPKSWSVFNVSWDDGSLIKRFASVDRSMSDDDVIQDAIKQESSSRLVSITDFKILQDPYVDKQPNRRYGNGWYNINNGLAILIEWFENSKSISSDNDDANNNIKKKITIGDSSGKNKIKYGIDKNSELGYLDKIGNDYFNFDGSKKDSELIKYIISVFKKSISKAYGDNDYNLEMCNPDTEYCSIISFKDPLKLPEQTLNQTISSTNNGGTQSFTNKVKLNIVGLPTVIKIKAKSDLPTFKVYAGEPAKDSNGNDIDFFDDSDLLSDEYKETGYKGEEETGIILLAWRDQNQVAVGQEDSSYQPGVSSDNSTITQVSNFNELIELAGRCARKLGFNSRVNSTNMKLPYTKGIHGLCPQGTLSILYALTGIEKIGKIRGNADWFSFKNPTGPPGGTNKGDFSKTGYYNNKIKISQINGSWKGTYLHSGQKNMWKVGDVVAMGYTDLDYGHIQVWTGFSWMSDFKQGDYIQQNKVDVDSVALWRLNQFGIDALNSQFKAVV